MTLILISLIITGIATLIQTFWKFEKLKPRLILFTFILLGIIFNFFITKNDAEENSELKADAERSQLLLESADRKLDAQSETIKTGFSMLTSQLSSQGGNNITILNTVKNLETNVNQLTIDSRNIISEVLETNDIHGSVRKNSNIFIPLGYKNAFILDTKNQFAVYDDKPDDKNRIKLIINNAHHYLAPGQQASYYDDQSKVVFLVYKAMEDKRMVFFVKDGR